MCPNLVAAAAVAVAPVVVHLRNECMWGDQLGKLLDTSGCSVPCVAKMMTGEQHILPNIVLDHCEIGPKPDYPVLHAALTLEYIGAAVEWNRPIVTWRDWIKQLRGRFHGGTLSLEHMKYFDLQVHWNREFADVYVNYMYAWEAQCGGSEKKKCVLPVPTVQDVESRPFAVAYVSHCAPQRIRYLRELNRRLLELSGGRRRITHRGACDHTKETIDESQQQHQQSFKFTLSFENSIRADYISEKHLNAVLRDDSVPVVWASPGVEDFMPGGRGSFVFALDFASPLELARHLLELDGNATKYLEYMAWRKQEGGVKALLFEEQAKYNLLARGKHGFMCRLCEAYVSRYC